ncbi:hypothetical protein DY000_02031127 [Brassica cretica]|uniref:Uncharacterized protein n=1 Tax=Brassica cretica TaxID=69181 RepID=A0ABQ7DI16_BRACR|nr:hypothetical protein DY000_02031127 [Brassica cretica]
MISSRRLLPLGETRLFQILTVWFPKNRDRNFDGASVSYCGRETCRCSADKLQQKTTSQISVMSLSRWNKGHGLLQVLLYTTASQIEVPKRSCAKMKLKNPQKRDQMQAKHPGVHSPQIDW